MRKKKKNWLTKYGWMILLLGIGYVLYNPEPIEAFICQPTDVWKICADYPEQNVRGVCQEPFSCSSTPTCEINSDAFSPTDYAWYCEDTLVLAVSACEPTTTHPITGETILNYVENIPECLW